jgi:two-component system, LuxR family, response regulator FixJ
MDVIGGPSSFDLRETAMHAEPVVFVVDDDVAACRKICELVGMMNLSCEVFSSGQEFLNQFDRTRSGCLVTELKVPGVGGLQIQQRLGMLQAIIPVIFVTAYGTLPIAVRALRAGAFHFLEKPIHEQELWDAIQEAVAMDQERRNSARREEDIRARVAALTIKEEQVLKMIADGMPNRVIAKELDVSIRTIEGRRATLMKKLGLNVPEELLRFAMAACNGHSNGNGHSEHRPRNGAGSRAPGYFSAAIPR